MTPDDAGPRGDVAARGAARRQVLATSLWLAAAVLLGGLDLPARGFEAFRFAPFGLVAGLLGILYVYALSVRGAIRVPAGWLGVLAVAYWVAGTATAFRVLLPPPGLLQVGLALGVALAAGVVASRRDAHGALTAAAIVVALLAVLRVGLVPVFEARSELPDWGPLRLGGAVDALRDLVVAYAPQRPAAEALHFGAVACIALAFRTQFVENAEA